MKGAFVEIGHDQVAKHGERAEGDVFLTRRSPEDGRIIAALSDGLGSGVKAGVLATLTATMAAGCAASDLPIDRAADAIMRSLPVCSERKISYATFTIADISSGGIISLVEYDNPAYILLREGSIVEPIKTEIRVKRGRSRGSRHAAENLGRLANDAILRSSRFEAKPGDRLVLVSDGVSQAGMGCRATPLGWGLPALERFVEASARTEPGISARELARRVVRNALSLDQGQARDDITCAVVYFREARRLLVLTGPPLDPARDPEMARIFSSFPGRRLVSGGTTASIIARETGATVKVRLGRLDPNIPPPSEMAGADLVTEGILTLGRAAELLASGARPETFPDNAAAQVIELMLDSDIIEFLVGTRINEAHQDPTMPVELEIRRNVVKRLAAVLEESYLKETKIRYL